MDFAYNVHYSHNLLLVSLSNGRNGSHYVAKAVYSY
jgi:hypothetical protein